MSSFACLQRAPRQNEAHRQAEFMFQDQKGYFLRVLPGGAKTEQGALSEAIFCDSKKVRSHYRVQSCSGRLVLRSTFACQQLGAKTEQNAQPVFFSFRDSFRKHAKEARDTIEVQYLFWVSRTFSRVGSLLAGRIGSGVPRPGP